MAKFEENEIKEHLGINLASKSLRFWMNAYSKGKFLNNISFKSVINTILCVDPFKPKINENN